MVMLKQLCLNIVLKYYKISKNVNIRAHTGGAYRAYCAKPGEGIK